MHLSFIGILFFFILQVYGATQYYDKTNKDSHFHQSNPAGVTFQRQRGNLQPVSYSYIPIRRLYNKKRFERKAVQHPTKRDFATTLKYLRAAMASYRKEFLTPPPPPPPVEMIPIEQQYPPNTLMLAPPAPLVSYYLAPLPPPTAPSQAEPISQIPDLETKNPPIPIFSTDSNILMPLIEKGNKMTESKPVTIDMEEDDYFDPEEDPDDVGPPPAINGVPVAREE